jgi:hypothetical protein
MGILEFLTYILIAANLPHPTMLIREPNSPVYIPVVRGKYIPRNHSPADIGISASIQQLEVTGRSGDYTDGQPWTRLTPILISAGVSDLIYKIAETD